jgi:Txe/YoeB family toxin of Txe-Axe toxin-antitoxin module
MEITITSNVFSQFPISDVRQSEQTLMTVSAVSINQRLTPHFGKDAGRVRISEKYQGIHMKKSANENAYKNHIYTNKPTDYYQPDTTDRTVSVKRNSRALRDSSNNRDVKNRSNSKDISETVKPTGLSDSKSKEKSNRSTISKEIVPQHKPMANAVASAQHRSAGNPHSITLRAIDKLILDLELKPHELDETVEQLKYLVSEKMMRRITNQSRFWKYVFSLNFDDHQKSRFSKNAGVVFQCEPIGKDAKLKIQVVLNPSLMEAQHVKTFMKILKTIFPTRHREMVRRCCVHRIDEAIDAAVVLDDLIVELGGAQVSARYYTKTDRSGRIESMYTGGIESEHHGVAYDQTTADTFKNEAGLAVPLNRDTADTTFCSRLGSTRIESRRVFKEPMTVTELLSLPSAMNEYRVLDLTRLRPRDLNPGFVAYLDCVRLRGVRGARLHLVKQFKNSTEIKAQVAAYDKRLASTGAEWWSAVDHTQQLSVLLKASPIWKFLQYAVDPV